MPIDIEYELPAAQVIGSAEIKEAQNTLEKYKSGLAAWHEKITKNNEWYRMRHWGVMKQSKPQEVTPNSAWLFNMLANKHADAMDNYPAARILPREAADQEEAELLSDIIPCILEQDDFEATYSAGKWYKGNVGTAVYGIFWDSTKLNGLGDISVKLIDALNIFWEPGEMDIQKSRNVFHIELRDNEELEAAYPQLKGKLSTPTMAVAQYVHDENIDTSNKSVVVDWYYKKSNSAGKRVLHYVKYVNDEVLYATENDPEKAERGWYDDGEYPFELDNLFPIWGEAGAFGYIDIAKNAQEYIDRLSQAILKNTLASATPRYFARASSGINRQQFLDLNNPIVDTAGNVDDQAIKPVDTKQLPGAALSVLQLKIDELKETTGTRDVATGGTTSGVTAASAIAAMQEAGSKLSRDDNKSSYRTFRRIVGKVIERIRQFYDLPRTFRILGPDGSMRFQPYTNAHLQPQDQGGAFGVDLGQRVPLFDVNIEAEKKSPYARISQNEMAMQFYGMGFFNPMQAPQALATLSMMDFDRKDLVIRTIAEGAVAYQQSLAAAAASGVPIDPAATEQPPQNGASVPKVNISGGESSTTSKARQHAAESTSPR